MKNKIVMVVGTSLFGRYQDKPLMYRTYALLSEQYDSISHQCKNLEHLPASERSNSKYDSDIRHIKDVMQLLYLPVAEEKCCKEALILSKLQDISEVVLVATDSVLSVVACELLKEYITNLGIKCIFNNNISATDTTIAIGVTTKNIVTENIERILDKHLTKDSYLVCSTFDSVQIFLARKYENVMLSLHNEQLYEL